MLRSNQLELLSYKVRLFSGAAATATATVDSEQQQSGTGVEHIVQEVDARIPDTGVIELGSDEDMQVG